MADKSFLESPKLSGLNTLITLVLTPLLVINILIAAGVLKPFDAPVKSLELSETMRLETSFAIIDTVTREMHQKVLEHKSRQFYMTYSLVNTGNQPIMITDFLDDCGVMTPPLNKIESVSSGNPFNIAGMGVYSEWGSKNQRDWFVKPVVINPKEHLDFTVVLDVAPGLSKQPSLDPNSVLRWRWRILGVTAVPFSEWAGMPNQYLVKFSDTVIQVNFFNTWFFAFLNEKAWLYMGLCSNLYIILLFLLLYGRQHHYPHPAILTFFAVILLFYSMCLGEITAYALSYSWVNLDRYCYLLIVASMVSFYFVFRKTPRNNKSTNLDG